MGQIPITGGARLLRPVRAKVIFNPFAGAVDESPYQLTEILAQLQAHAIIPEVHLVTPESVLPQVVANALRRDLRLVIVCGGDSTIESSIPPMVSSRALLGIIPTGTRNNIARSLGIPTDIAAAVSLLRSGKRLAIDVGRAISGHSRRWFLESSSIGLVPALYPAADDIQRGNLSRVAELITTLVSSQPASLQLTVDGEQHSFSQAHLALVSNMPFFGANIQIAPDISYFDQHLDVFVFSALTKLELVSYALQTIGGSVSDARILHYRARNVVLRSSPRMPVMADSFPIGEGCLTASVRRDGLRVIAGEAARRGEAAP